MVNISARLKNFFTKNPAKTPSSLPLAIDAEGEVWNFELNGHGIVGGRPGSGKSSVIHGTIRQLAPFAADGAINLYGIDPKGGELRIYDQSGIFKKIALDQDMQAISVIDRVHSEMRTALDARTVGFRSDESGGETTPTAVLIIEEFVSVWMSLAEMNRAGKLARGRLEDIELSGTTGEVPTDHLEALVARSGMSDRAFEQLEQIMAMGRSAGVYVIASVQSAPREILGRAERNFRTRALLGQDSAYHNDRFLGEDAAQRGFDSTAIPRANKANEYSAAGMGFVKDDSGDPKMVRFAYSPDEEVAELVRKYPKLYSVDPMDANLRPHEVLMGITGSGRGRIGPVKKPESDKLYEIDPMETPLKPYEASPLFEELETEDPIQHSKIIDAIYKRMKRSGN